MLTKVLKQTLNSLTNTRSTKLALIVRSDLNMSKGKTAAQCAHAAVICYQQAQAGDANQCKLVNDWSTQGQPKIVLRVQDYAVLEDLHRQAQAQQIVSCIVKDAGHTQLAPGTATVLGLGPDKVERIDQLVAHLKLL